MYIPYVYAITDGEFIKIGVAQVPHKRLKELATGNALSLFLLGWFDGGYELEKELHARFKKVRDNGEWMHPTQDLLDYLNEKLHDKFIVLDNGKIRWYRKMSHG